MEEVDGDYHCEAWHDKENRSLRLSELLNRKEIYEPPPPVLVGGSIAMLSSDSSKGDSAVVVAEPPPPVFVELPPPLFVGGSMVYGSVASLIFLVPRFG